MALPTLSRYFIRSQILEPYIVPQTSSSPSVATNNNNNSNTSLHQQQYQRPFSDKEYNHWNKKYGCDRDTNTITNPIKKPREPIFLQVVDFNQDVQHLISGYPAFRHSHSKNPQLQNQQQRNQQQKALHHSSSSSSSSSSACVYFALSDGCDLIWAVTPPRWYLENEIVKNQPFPKKQQKIKDFVDCIFHLDRGTVIKITHYSILSSENERPVMVIASADWADYSMASHVLLGSPFVPPDMEMTKNNIVDAYRERARYYDRQLSRQNSVARGLNNNNKRPEVDPYVDSSGNRYFVPAKRETFTIQRLIETLVKPVAAVASCGRTDISDNDDDDDFDSDDDNWSRPDSDQYNDDSQDNNNNNNNNNYLSNINNNPNSKHPGSQIHPNMMFNAANNNNISNISNINEVDTPHSTSMIKDNSKGNRNSTKTTNHHYQKQQQHQSRGASPEPDASSSSLSLIENNQKNHQNIPKVHFLDQIQHRWRLFGQVVWMSKVRKITFPAELHCALWENNDNNDETTFNNNNNTSNNIDADETPLHVEYAPAPKSRLYGGNNSHPHNRNHRGNHHTSFTPFDPHLSPLEAFTRYCERQKKNLLSSTSTGSSHNHNHQSQYYNNNNDGIDTNNNNNNNNNADNIFTTMTVHVADVRLVDHNGDVINVVLFFPKLRELLPEIFWDTQNSNNNGGNLVVVENGFLEAVPEKITNGALVAALERSSNNSNRNQESIDDNDETIRKMRRSFEKFLMTSNNHNNHNTRLINATQLSTTTTSSSTSTSSLTPQQKDYLFIMYRKFLSDRARRFGDVAGDNGFYLIVSQDDIRNKQVPPPPPPRVSTGRPSSASRSRATSLSAGLNNNSSVAARASSSSAARTSSSYHHQQQPKIQTMLEIVRKATDAERVAFAKSSPRRIDPAHHTDYSCTENIFHSLLAAGEEIECEKMKQNKIFNQQQQQNNNNNGNNNNNTLVHQIAHVDQYSVSGHVRFVTAKDEITLGNNKDNNSGKYQYIRVNNNNNNNNDNNNNDNNNNGDNNNNNLQLQQNHQKKTYRRLVYVSDIHMPSLLACMALWGSNADAIVEEDVGRIVGVRDARIVEPQIYDTNHLFVKEYTRNRAHLDTMMMMMSNNNNNNNNNNNFDINDDNNNDPNQQQQQKGLAVVPSTKTNRTTNVICGIRFRPTDGSEVMILNGNNQNDNNDCAVFQRAAFGNKLQNRNLIHRWLWKLSGDLLKKSALVQRAKNREQERHQQQQQQQQQQQVSSVSQNIVPRSSVGATSVPTTGFQSENARATTGSRSGGGRQSGNSHLNNLDEDNDADEVPLILDNDENDNNNDGAMNHDNYRQEGDEDEENAATTTGPLFLLSVAEEWYFIFEGKVFLTFAAHDAEFRDRQKFWEEEEQTAEILSDLKKLKMKLERREQQQTQQTQQQQQTTLSSLDADAAVANPNSSQLLQTNNNNNDNNMMMMMMMMDSSNNNNYNNNNTINSLALVDSRQQLQQQLLQSSSSSSSTLPSIQHTLNTQYNNNNNNNSLTTDDAAAVNNKNKNKNMIPLPQEYYPKVRVRVEAIRFIQPQDTRLFCIRIPCEVCSKPFPPSKIKIMLREKAQMLRAAAEGKKFSSNNKNLICDNCKQAARSPTPQFPLEIVLSDVFGNIRVVSVVNAVEMLFSSRTKMVFAPEILANEAKYVARHQNDNNSFWSATSSSPTMRDACMLMEFFDWLKATHNQNNNTKSLDDKTAADELFQQCCPEFMRTSYSTVKMDVMAMTMNAQQHKNADVKYTLIEIARLFAPLPDYSSNNDNDDDDPFDQKLAEAKRNGQKKIASDLMQILDEI